MTARELVVTTRRLEDLLPYAKNARTHSDEQVRQIAASIREYGWTNPVLVDESDGIIAGHGRVLAAQELGHDQVPTILLEGLTPSQVQAYRLADNKLALNAGWSDELLALELQDLEKQGFSLDLTGFSKMEQLEFLEWRAPGEHITPPDTPPLVQLAPVSERGTVWALGAHRLMCGDSCDAADVARLLEDAEKAALLHADPPYGMGKEAAGIANDNLYEEKLDAFQVSWWEIWREYLESNASIYIWGNPADLWRLWWRHLESKAVTLRNELVWDKGSAPGIASAERRMYSITTERCLFFMLGRQAFGNVNLEDYWDGFEPIREYLAAEADKMRWGPKQIQAICGVGMFAHWFSKSQWIMIPRKHYETLQAAAAGAAFTQRFEDLRATYDRLLAPGDHLNPKTAFYETRSYFDNGAREHDRGVGLPPGERRGALQTRNAEARQDDRAVREVLERGRRVDLGALRRHRLNAHGRGGAWPPVLHHGA